ncbi:MAG: hypothetical protein GKR91_19910 [Pseudomonadales bacterium]|nr:hypothetical protein [Pseudomonadales bacterium]
MATIKINNSYSTSYSGSNRFGRSSQRRNKVFWAGISSSDAYRANLDYSVRQSAKRQLTRDVNTATKKIVTALGVSNHEERKAKAKQQLSPIFSSYPTIQATAAAVGLTAFLEFKTRSPDEVLRILRADYLSNPAEHDDVLCDSETYRKMAEVCTEWVGTRIKFNELTSTCNIPQAEIYRLYSAAMETLKFESLPEIVRIATTVGDIIPPPELLNMHPFSEKLYRKTNELSYEYLDSLADTAPEDKISLCCEWARELCQSLQHHLPYPFSYAPYSLQEDDDEHYFNDGFAVRGEISDKIPPLLKPTRPMLFEPNTAAERIAKESRPPRQVKDADGKLKSIPDPKAEILKDIAATLEAASSQKGNWEDMRSDKVAAATRGRPFNSGPLEGIPTDGSEVTLKVGENEFSGEIFDRPLETKSDPDAVEKLIQDSDEISQALKRNFHPNVQPASIVERIRTSGSFDGNRLPLAKMSDAIYKRFRIEEAADRRGSPLILIAVDGSSSLNQPQMELSKTLTAGWLRATKQSSAKVAAAIFTSGNVRRGLGGQVVQWICHPNKTENSLAHSLDAIASLPNSGGYGSQEDAKALSFIISDGAAIAMNSMIYLILITDTMWNKSFHASNMTSLDEVKATFESAKSQLGSRFHSTLVSLGRPANAEMDGVVDKTIAVTSDDLTDPAAVAEKIGLYVASCIRERSKYLRKE